MDRRGTAWLVRSPGDADRGALVGMYRDFDPARRSLGLPPADPGEIESWLERLLDRGRNFVAVRDGAVRGHAVFSPDGGAEPELAAFVRREASGRGVGTELCRHAVAAAAEAGADALVLDVARDNDAIRLYRRLGFERVDDRPGVTAGDAVRMRLDLPRPEAESTRLAPARR